MRLLILALVLAPGLAHARSCLTTCVGTPAQSDDAEIAPSEPQPLSGNPGWALAAYAGVGAVMMNTAGGQHLLTPEVTLASAVRMSDLATMRTIYELSWRRDGAESSNVWVDNTYHVLAPRFDLTYGTPGTQFVIGAGPAVVLTTTRLHGPGRNVHATDFAPGFVYGVGLRWKWRALPVALDFGGQQRALRHDFRATFSMGIPLLSSVTKDDEPLRGRRVE